MIRYAQNSYYGAKSEKQIQETYSTYITHFSFSTIPIYCKRIVNIYHGVKICMFVKF